MALEVAILDIFFWRTEKCKSATNKRAVSSDIGRCLKLITSEIEQAAERYIVYTTKNQATIKLASAFTLMGSRLGEMGCVK